MKLRIVSAELALAAHVHARLAKRGYTSEVVGDATAEFTVRYRAGLADDALDGLLAALLPLQPEVRAAPGLDVDVELHLTIAAAAQHVRLAADTEPLRDALAAELEALGFVVYAVLEPAHDRGLYHGRVAPAIRQLVRSVAARHGCFMGETPSNNEDDGLLLWASDPRDKDPAAAAGRVPIVIESDDAASGEQLRARLIEAGFAHATTEVTAAGERFELEPGPLRKTLSAWAALEDVVKRYLEERGLSARRYPLHRALGDEVSPPRIALPLGALADGLLPSAGPWFERWPVRIRIDDLAIGARLAERLRVLGFSEVTLAELPDDAPGCVVRWETAAEHALVEQALRTAIDEILAAPQPVVWMRRDGQGPVIEIDLPIAASDAERARRFAAAGSGTRVVVHATDPAQRALLEQALAPLGFGALEMSHICVLETPRIWAHRVPDVVAARIATLVHAVTGVAIAAELRPGDTSDIEVFVPARAQVTPVQPVRQIDALFDTGEGWLRFADVRLTRTTDPSPPTDLLDQPRAEALLHIAHCAQDGLPCLLMGDARAEAPWLAHHAAGLMGRSATTLDLRDIRANALAAMLAAAAPGSWFVLDGIDEAAPEVRGELARTLRAPRPDVFLCGIAPRACSVASREPWLGDYVLREPRLPELHGLLQAYVYGAPVAIVLRGRAYRQTPPAPTALTVLADRPDSPGLVAALARLAVRIGASHRRALAWLDTFAAMPPDHAWRALVETAAANETPAVRELAAATGITLI